MHWMNKLERKIGKYAIPHLIIYILIAYGIGYVLVLFAPEVYSMLQMNPAAIFHGQVWRLITWVTCIPSNLSLFTIFMFLFYYWIGQTLERAWGTFRYNMFIFLGYFLTTLGPILMYVVIGIIYGFDFANVVSNYGYLTSSTSYINLTSFLAFAMLFPNQEVYFMFIFRIKMKWLAIADAVLLGYEFLRYIASAVLYPESRILYIAEAVCLLCSVASFIIYYFATRDYKKMNPKEIKRKRKYHKQVKEAKVRGTKHYCAVCGRTEVSNPELQFRFCSKCKGNLEYCNEHLFTHEHRT